MCLPALPFRKVQLKPQLRVREEINLYFQESRRPHGKARGGRIAGYLTDKQRSQAEWIGTLKREVIFERAHSASRAKRAIYGWKIGRRET